MEIESEVNMSSNIWNADEQKLVQVSGNVNINDSVTSADSTWSSEKIDDSLVDKHFPSGTEFYLDEQNGKFGFNTSKERGADTFFPFKSGGDIQYYRCVENIGPNKTVTKSFSEIGFVPKIVICMNGDSALLRYLDGSFAIAIGSGLVSLNNLDTYNKLEITDEKITLSIRWHADAMSYNIIFLG